MKLRESLDKQDKRDVAQAVFAQDRNGRLIDLIDELRSLTLNHEGDDADDLIRNAENLSLARSALMEQWVLDEEHIFTEKDRPAVTMGVNDRYRARRLDHAFESLRSCPIALQL